MTNGKLVRDRIPDVIRASGREPSVRYIAGEDLVVALGAKLCEEAREAAEVIGSRDQLVEELADVEEVLTALKSATGITDDEVAMTAARKAAERGRFDNGVWLVSAPPPVNRSDHDIAAAALGLLTATYADSDRFGEVTLDYLAAMGNDTGKVVRLATGLTAVARVLIGMRQIETGASSEDTLEELGRRLRQLYPS